MSVYLLRTSACTAWLSYTHLQSELALAGSGPPSSHGSSRLAVRLVPQDRQASWDSQKCLAFTPPASLSTAQRSRRVSQGLPGGAGKPNQSDDAALRLPPLTPPAAEASTPPAPSPLPWMSPTPFAFGSASCLPSRSSSPFPLSSHLAAAGLLTQLMPASLLAPPVPALADLDKTSATSSWDAQQASGQQSKALQNTQPLLNGIVNAAMSSQELDSESAACSEQSQTEDVVGALQQEQQDRQQQPLASPRAASSPKQQQRRLSNAAGDDTGQLGPPITRMRPAAVPPRKGPAKETAAADSLQSAAEAILFDALLCGWEEQSNDGVSCQLCSDYVTPTTEPVLCRLYWMSIATTESR